MIFILYCIHPPCPNEAKKPAAKPPAQVVQDRIQWTKIPQVLIPNNSSMIPPKQPSAETVGDTPSTTAVIETETTEPKHPVKEKHLLNEDPSQDPAILVLPTTQQLFENLNSTPPMDLSLRPIL